MTRRQRKVLSCGAVVVRQTPDGWLFLMLRAFSHWDFPKGLVEAGESSLQAAIREVREETSLDDLEFAWGEEFFDSGPYSRGKTARYYLARTRRSDVAILPNPETGRPEHAEFRWLTASEAMRLAVPRVKEVLGWATDRMQREPRG